MGTALDVLAAAVTVALLLLSGLGLGGPVRVLVALVFVSFVPGWAVLDWAPFAEGLAKLAVAAILSLTISTGLALGQLWLRLWHPEAVLSIAAVASLVALLSHLAGPEDLTRMLSGAHSSVSRNRR